MELLGGYRERTDGAGIRDGLPLHLKIEFENADRQKFYVSETVTLKQLKITESGKLES